MTNQEELNISNKSYINKDFPVIYNELLNLIPELTDKWDPRTSNESDPGLVITKLMAFIADKLNYNADKNALERFMPSATQITSMRELCEMMGYNMKYFISAETPITFSYVGDAMSGEKQNITLPMFTVVSSTDGDITYVTTQECNLARNNAEGVYTKTVPAIEGTLSTLIVNNSDVIRLTDLDDNRRVYFPVLNVAENGIFIISTNKEEKFWEKVNNLNAQALNQKIFKFGYDSYKDKAYVEFPEDIANLIGDGLVINYIISKGINGNVKAKYLTTLNSPTEFTVWDDNVPTDITISFTADGTNTTSEKSTLIIKNSSASINGRNPETIDEAYNGFKKTIGTFDTLVTCRDYANAIYNTDYVSNIQVTDRRDDINYATKVVTFDREGIKYRIDVNTGSDDTPVLSANDLCLYPLKPFTYVGSDEISAYQQSFNPLSSIGVITDYLENSQTISHNYKDTTGASIYAIKAMYTLNSNISTTHKVGAYEEADILRNVRNALIAAFNARNVDYGYEIPYETILKTIENADSRISSVSLAEPLIEAKIMNGSGIESEEFDLSNIVEKNVLAGRLSLFDYDEKFDYDFGQTNTSSETEINTITSKFSKTITSGTSYTLKKNEVVQLIGPSYVTDIQYPAYYLFTYKNTNAGTIPSGNIHKMTNDEVLICVGTTSSGRRLTEIYDTNKLVKPVGFTMKTVEELSYGQAGYRTVKKLTKDDVKIGLSPEDQVKFDTLCDDGKVVTDGDDVLFYVLAAEEEINIVKKNEVIINKPTYCYWLRNNSRNRLFNIGEITGDTASVTLRDGEYFFYTDNGFYNLITVGSGTTLNFSSVLAIGGSNLSCEKVDLGVLENNGLLAVREVWKRLPFNASLSNTLDIVENNILTLVEGDSFTPTLNASITLDNTYKEFNGTDFLYTIEDESKALDMYTTGDKWLIRSRLDINAGPDKSQTLLAGHSISFNGDDNNPITNKNILFSRTLEIAGDTDVDVTYIDILDNKRKPIDAYIYALDISQGAPNVMYRDETGFAKLELSENYDKTFKVPAVANTDNSLVMVYWQPEDNAAKLTINSGTAGTVPVYNGTATTSLDASTLYVLDLHGVTDLRIRSTKKGTLLVDKIRYVTGYNQYICEDATTRENVGDAVKTALSSVDQFYYTNKQDNDLAIKLDSHTHMDDAITLFDFNNVFNKITIPEIDFNSSIIRIARSSKQ